MGDDDKLISRGFKFVYGLRHLGAPGGHGSPGKFLRALSMTLKQYRRRADAFGHIRQEKVEIVRLSQNSVDEEQSGHGRFFSLPAKIVIFTETIRILQDD